MDWATIVTADTVGGVLDGVKSLLPVLMPVMVGFIAIRKGISFLLGTLHKA